MKSLSICLLTALVALPAQAKEKLSVLLDTQNEASVEYVFIPLKWTGQMTSFPVVVRDDGKTVRFRVQAIGDKKYDLSKYLKARQNNGVAEILESPALSKACKSSQTEASGFGIDKSGVTDSGAQWSFRMGIFTEPSAPVKSGLCPAAITVYVPREMTNAKVVAGGIGLGTGIDFYDQIHIEARRAGSEEERYANIFGLLNKQKKLGEEMKIPVFYDQKLLETIMPYLSTPEQRLKLMKLMAQDLIRGIPSDRRFQFPGIVSEKYFDGGYLEDLKQILKRR